MLVDCYTLSSPEQHSTHLVYLQEDKICDLEINFKKLLESVGLSQDEELKIVTSQPEVTDLDFELDGDKKEIVRYWNQRYASEYEG